MKNPLSKREKEILVLVIKERTSQQIADELNISIRTIDTHRKNILRKTNTSTIIGLLKFAIKSHLLEDFYYKQSNNKNLKNNT